MAVQLAPCEGEAHVGETTLSRGELDGLKDMLSSDDVTKAQVELAIRALKPSLSSELDRNAVAEAEQAVGLKGSRGQTVGRAIALLITVIDRVFPTGIGGGGKVKYCLPRAPFTAVQFTPN